MTAEKAVLVTADQSMRVIAKARGVQGLTGAELRKEIFREGGAGRCAEEESLELICMFCREMIFLDVWPSCWASARVHPTSVQWSLARGCDAEVAAFWSGRGGSWSILPVAMQKFHSIMSLSIHLRLNVTL